MHQGQVASKAAVIFFAELPECDGFTWGDFVTLQRAGVSGSQPKSTVFKEKGSLVLFLCLFFSGKE